MFAALKTFVGDKKTMADKEMDPRWQARKKAVALDKKLGVTDRIISLKIIRPFNEELEAEFREFKKNLNAKEQDKKKRKKAIIEFFDNAKTKNGSLISYKEAFEGFAKASRFTRDVYNLAVSMSFAQLMVKTKKLDIYGNVGQAPNKLKDTHNISNVPSTLKMSLTKSVSSNFRIGEILKGNRTIPEARSDYPISFYLSQGGEQVKESLVKFYVYSYAKKRLTESTR